jgi:hypothetical protein
MGWYEQNEQTIEFEPYSNEARIAITMINS